MVVEEGEIGRLGDWIILFIQKSAINNHKSIRGSERFGDSVLLTIDDC
jgi:hypothetical protein